MKNYTYNGMNAHEIADKITANEEAYLKIDFESLSFEDKCSYAAHHYGIYHPLFRQGRDTENLQHSLVPELCKRAGAGDSKAMYYLAVFHPDTTHRSDEHRTMVERAMAAGSLEAHIYFASWFCRDDSTKAYSIIKEALKQCSGDDMPDNKEEYLYSCYSILADIGQTSEERAYFKALVDELALKRVLRGEYTTLTHLCAKNKAPKDPITKQYVFDEETVFWKTVNFLVESYFYEKWNRHSSDNLGIWLIRGIGCDADFEAAKRFYIDVYFRKSFDKNKMLEVLGVSNAETLNEFEQLLEKSREAGEIEAYWKLILLGILRNDVNTIEQLCAEAIKKNPDRLMEIMPKAYTKLLLSK